MITRYDNTTKIADVSGGGSLKAEIQDVVDEATTVKHAEFKCGFNMDGHLYRIGNLVLFRISGAGKSFVSQPTEARPLDEKIPAGYRPATVEYDCVVCEQNGNRAVSWQQINPDGSMSLLNQSVDGGFVGGGMTCWITNDLMPN